MPASIRGAYGNRGCEAHEVDFDDSTALTQEQQLRNRSCCFFAPSPAKSDKRHQSMITVPHRTQIESEIRVEEEKRPNTCLVSRSKVIKNGLQTKPIMLA